MTMTKPFLVPFIVLTMAVGISNAFAHCDSEDGPVGRAVQAALESGNVNLVLPYAPASAETELKATFEDARKARVLGPEARKVADRLFLETAIRLHRAGEGATLMA